MVHAVKAHPLLRVRPRLRHITRERTHFIGRFPDQPEHFGLRMLPASTPDLCRVVAHNLGAVVGPLRACNLTLELTALSRALGTPLLQPPLRLLRLTLAGRLCLALCLALRRVGGGFARRALLVPLLPLGLERGPRCVQRCEEGGVARDGFLLTLDSAVCGGHVAHRVFDGPVGTAQLALRCEQRVTELPAALHLLLRHIDAPKIAPVVRRQLLATEPRWLQLPDDRARDRRAPHRSDHPILFLINRLLINFTESVILLNIL